MRQVEEWWTREESQRTPTPPALAQWAPGLLPSIASCWGRQRENNLIFMPRVLLNKMNPAHIFLLFVLVSDPTLRKVWMAEHQCCFCSAKTVPAAECYLCPRMPFIHTCTEAKPPCSSCCALCKVSQVTAKVSFSYIQGKKPPSLLQ